MSSSIRRRVLSSAMGVPACSPTPGWSLGLMPTAMTMSMPEAMANAMAMICRTPAPGEPWEAMGGS